MKKTLSILLTVLMIALSFTFLVSAEDAPVCNCYDHQASPAYSCKCCFYCDNLNVNAVTPCMKDGNGVKKDADGFVVETCCGFCDGWREGCHCDCECCPKGTTSNDQNNELLDDNQKEQVVNGFQKVLARFREFFDNLFNTIFEFLRFDEIMGNN